MPKEYLNHTENPTSIEDGYPTSFSLHWQGGDGAVIQYGVTLDIDRTLEHIQLVKKHSPGDKTVEFYTMPLSRTDTQRSIKALRRARDAAYGADE